VNYIFLGLYRFIFRPLALLLSPVLQTKYPKIKSGIEDRKNFSWEEQKIESPLWIHCASGEFEYAKDILKQVKEKFPEEKTLVTYFSPSYKKWIQKFPQVDFWGPLPLDSKKRVCDFLDHTAPKVLGIARTDLWPELLIQYRRRKIPILLFSKTIPEKSSWLQARVQNWLLSLVDQIFLVSKKHYELPPKKLQHKSQIVGDSRYDQCWNRKNAAIIKPKPQPQKKSLLLASLWPGDEKVLSPVLVKLAKTFHIIWVPHEPKPDDFFNLQKKFPSLRTLPYSQLNIGDEPQDHDILLVDETGVLADLFQWAHLSFIGGSFDRQVHSVMESLAWGVPALVGPRHKKNPEAIEFMSQELLADDLFGVFEIKNSSEFEATAMEYFKSWLPKHSKKLTEKFEEKCGASTQIVDWLLDANV